MTDSGGHISPFQGSLLLAEVLIAVLYLHYPEALVATSGPAAWQVALVMTGLASLLFLPMAALARRFPGKGLAEISVLTAGPALGTLLTLGVVAWLISVAALTVRGFVETFVVALLPQTPPSLLTLAVIGCALYASFLGTEALARATLIFLPLVVGGGALLMLLSLPRLDAALLFPFWGNGLPQTLYGGLRYSCMFAETILLLVLGDCFRSRKGLPTATIAGILMFGTAATLMVTVLVAVFGAPDARELPFPLFELARLVYLGRFLQRVEAIIVLLWFFAAGVRIAACFHGAVVAAARSLRLPYYRPLIYPFGVILFSLSMMPKDFGSAIRFEQEVMWPIGLAVLALPFLLWLLASLRRRSAVAGLLLLSLLLGGCWDRREVEETAFVLAVGVDPGERSMYAITFMIAIPSRLAGGEKGGGGKEERPYMITTVEAPTVAGALSVVNSLVDRRVSLLHNKVLLIGEDLARISGLSAMDEFVRFRESRRSVFYFVTRAKAADFLRGIQPELEKDPQRFIVEMVNTSRYTGVIPQSSQIENFVRLAHTGYGQPVTLYAGLKEEGDQGEGKPGGEENQSGFKAGELPRRGGPNVEVIGAAAFRRDRMVGVLDGEQTRSLLILQDRFRKGYFSIPDPLDPDLYISLDLRRSRPTTVTVQVDLPEPHLNTQVELEGEILAIQSGRDYTQPELQEILERAVEKDLRQKMLDLIRTSQAWESDIVGFGRYVVRTFPTVGAWEAYNWEQKYAEARVDLQVRVSLRRFGLQLSPPKSVD